MKIICKTCGEFLAVAAKDNLLFLWRDKRKCADFQYSYQLYYTQFCKEFEKSPKLVYNSRKIIFSFFKLFCVMFHITHKEIKQLKKSTTNICI